MGTSRRWEVAMAYVLGADILLQQLLQLMEMGDWKYGEETLKLGLGRREYAVDLNSVERFWCFCTGIHWNGYTQSEKGRLFRVYGKIYIGTEGVILFLRKWNPWKEGTDL